VNYERDAFRRGAIDRNRAFMTAVDAEVRGHVLTLTALAASKRLEVDDLPAFREEAQRVVKSQPDWQSVNLTLPSGQQVLNTNRPLGSDLPLVSDLESVQRAVRTPSAGSRQHQSGPDEEHLCGARSHPDSAQRVGSICSNRSD
jgi:hypothetical protein